MRVFIFSQAFLLYFTFNLRYIYDFYIFLMYKDTSIEEHLISLQHICKILSTFFRTCNVHSESTFHVEIFCFLIINNLCKINVTKITIEDGLKR